MKKTQTPISSSIGNHEMKIDIRKDCSSSCFAPTCTPSFIRSPTIHASPGDAIVYGLPSTGVTFRLRPCTSTRLMRPFFASSIICE